MSDYLNFSTITGNDTVRNIAEKSNTETTDNSTIDTRDEWKNFMHGIVEAFTSGELSYEDAKKYITDSSSIFTKRNKYDNAFTSGVLQGIDDVNTKHDTKFGRKVESWLSPNYSYSYIFNKATATVQNLIAKDRKPVKADNTPKSDNKDTALNNAPQKEDDSFNVGKFIEEMFGFLVVIW